MDTGVHRVVFAGHHHRGCASARHNRPVYRGHSGLESGLASAGLWGEQVNHAADVTASGMQRSTEASKNTELVAPSVIRCAAVHVGQHGVPFFERAAGSTQRGAQGLQTAQRGYLRRAVRGELSLTQNKRATGRPAHCARMCGGLPFRVTRGHPCGDVHLDCLVVRVRHLHADA